MVNERAAPFWRLFVAVWPDAVARDAIAEWRQAWIWPTGAALVPPERLHLTVHFLGNVAPARLPALTAGLRVPFEPFQLQFDSGEVWPGGIAVLCPAATPPELGGLHGRLAAALAALHLPVEPRRYRAHVTLARRATGARPPPGDPKFTWRADAGFVLARSLPNGGGYQVVQRFS